MIYKYLFILSLGLAIFNHCKGTSDVKNNAKLDKNKLYHWEFISDIIYPRKITKDGKKVYASKENLAKELEKRDQFLDERRSNWYNFYEKKLKNPKELSQKDITGINEILKKEEIMIGKHLSIRILERYMPQEAIGVHLVGHITPNQINGLYVLLIDGVFFEVIDNSGFGLDPKPNLKILEISTQNPYFKIPEGIYPKMTLKVALKSSMEGLVFEKGWGYYLTYPSGWMAKINVDYKDKQYHPENIMKHKESIKITKVFRGRIPRRYRTAENYTKVLGY